MKEFKVPDDSRQVLGPSDHPWTGNQTAKNPSRFYLFCLFCVFVLFVSSGTIDTPAQAARTLWEVLPRVRSGPAPPNRHLVIRGVNA